MKFLLLGAAGYLFYEWWLAQQQGAVSVSSTVPTTSSPNTAVVPTSSNTVTVALPTLRDQLLQMSGHPVVQTTDQWTYYYSKLRNVTLFGTTQYANLMTSNGVIGTTIMNVDQYISMLHSAGLGGLGMTTAMSRLVPKHANRASFQNAPYGHGAPGRPYSETVTRPFQDMPYSPFALRGIGIDGLGRTYLSGYAGPGIGMIGQGYGINETVYGGASAYEMADKYVM